MLSSEDAEAPIIDADRPPLLLPPEDFDLAGWQTRADDERSRGRLLEIVLHQVSVTSIMLAVTGSLLNFALEHPDREDHARSRLGRYVPPDPVELPIFLVELAARPETVRLVTEIMDFSSGVRLARAACLGALSGGWSTGTTAELASAICDSCLQSVSVLRTLCAAAAEPAGNAEPPRVAAYAERMAFAAGHGGWPFVRDGGGVEMPSWIAGRSTSRVPVAIRCRVRVGAECFDIAIGDLTLHGAGLAEAPALVPASTVELIPPDGVAIAAEVVWASGARSGVRFREPLTQQRFRQLQRGDDAL